MKTILVTGGAGFIGSHTCLVLIERGYEVYVFESFQNSSEISLKRVSLILKSMGNDLYKNLHLFKGDIRKKEDLINLFKKVKSQGKSFSAVIHLAGLKSVRDSILHPIKYWEFNVQGTINLVQVMNAFNCRTIVFSSSASVYGTTNKLFLNEDDPIKPINPYAMTKFVIEKFLNDLSLNSKDIWKVANLRYFNPIGAHCSGLIGEDPTGNPNNIFPLITDVAAGKLKQLEVYGNDWPTLDGFGVRDYIHVMDLAEGHINTLEFIYKNVPQVINLNIGTGKGVSVLELIEKFQTINNVNVPYIIGPRREGDVARLIADNTKIKKLLHWEPRRNIETMCIDGWIWRKQNPNGYE